MKIHFIIEFETNEAGVPIGMKARKVQPVAHVPPGVVVHLADGQTVTMPGKRRGRPRKVAIADVAPEPIPPLPQPTPPTGVTMKQASGPQFDPGFLKIVQDTPQPFTRRSLAVATGLDPVDVTQRLIRLHKKGWIIQPARELWKRTATFGVKA